MKKVAILTSGGDAPGMNAAIRACVRYATSKGLEVYGVDRGYKGLIENNIFPLTSRSVSNTVHLGGTFLKSARCLEFKDIKYRKIAAENLKKLGIDGLIVIGGDGSFTGAKALSDDCGINVVGIPATIDNDLQYTDYTLGFDTAVNTVLPLISNLRDTMDSHDRAVIIEVMGRNCGDIALYSAICGGAEMCLVPEIPFDINKVATTMLENRKKGKCSNILVVAEGVKGVKDLEKTLIGLTGMDIKTTTLGHIQRGGAPSMADRMLATRFSIKAVDCIVAGKTNRVVGIKNNEIFDENITTALSIPRQIDEKLYEIAKILSI